MKKNFFAITAMAFVVVCGLAWASDIALVYVNDETALRGKPIIGTVVPDGVLVPADQALAAGGTMLIGVAGQDVKKADMVRLDKDLNIALFRLGDKIVNPELQAVHQKRIGALQSFLPVSAEQTSTAASGAATPAVVENPSGSTLFSVLTNGKPVSKDVLHLKPFLKKSKFKMELVYVSTTPSYTFSFEITSNPKMGFWNRNRTTSLNDVPKHSYKYEHQAFVIPVKAGKKFDFPLEGHYIDEKDYEWTVKLQVKDTVQEEKIYVHMD